ncbi:MAG: hypothetical protein GTO14_21365, partial [Anaerolineales bacterium]|nr:hypothetical protein [Anaerolineales bacterium]
MAEGSEMVDVEGRRRSMGSNLRRGWIVVVVVLAIAFVVPNWLEEIQDRGWRRYSSQRGYDYTYVVDKEGHLWISEWRREEWKIFSSGLRMSWLGDSSYRAQPPRGPGEALAVDSSGRVWVANANWINVHQGEERWDADVVSLKVKGESVTALVFDHQDNLWVGTEEGLAMRSPDGDWEWYAIASSGQVGKYVRALVVDQEGRVWVGTDDGLIAIEASGEWLLYRQRNSGICSDDVTALAVDRDGSIWIGTSVGLCVRGTEGQWTTFRSSASILLGHSVRAISIDEQHRKWVATTTGMSLIEPDGGVITYKPSYSGVPRGIKSFIVDSEGLAWVGAYSGLYVFDHTESPGVGTLRTVTSIIQFLGVLRCLSVPTLLLLGVITIVRRRRKPEEVILEVPAPLPVTRITRPSVDIPTDPHAAFAQAEIY